MSVASPGRWEATMSHVFSKKEYHNLDEPSLPPNAITNNTTVTLGSSTTPADTSQQQTNSSASTMNPVRTVPPFVGSAVAPSSNERTYISPWSAYIKASGGPPQRKLSPSEAARANEIWHKYDSKPHVPTTEAPMKRVKIPWYKLHSRIKPFIMTNHFAPLLFRFFILCTSITALGLESGILSSRTVWERCVKNSTYLAIIIDSLAIPYTAYIAKDEFYAPPIGLRKATKKLKLLLPDLFFIVFEAINLCLGVGRLTDKDWVCVRNTDRGTCYDEGVCDVQKGLVAVLTVASVAWLSTFVISLARLMGKVRN